jgi:NTE family protein
MDEASSPVVGRPGEPIREPDLEIGLALSGGGYKATLFHLGGFLRLFELGLLQNCSRISSVSGGSITAAKVALEWSGLRDRAAFFERVVEPLRKMTATTIDSPSILGGVLLPGTVADRVSEAYDRVLFHGKTLQDLPDEPRFVINATNVETGSLWRFMKPYMRDYQVGEVQKPTVKLAEAVTASSAFPPVLSPFVLEVGKDDFSHVEAGVDPKFLEEITLTDGGVYDNLGLETVYKRCRTLLVADAGGPVAPDPSPPGDWLRHTKRVIDVIHHQVSSVRVRQLVAAFNNGERTGAYWGIATDIARHHAPGRLQAPHPRTLALARMPARLKRMDMLLQDRMINWGYAACDATVRAHYLPQAAPPSDWPYPESKV